ncbi:hypothetical protein, partial [Parabacteroides merdae]|uniref:hypothetical protein n=1 Tax=Parabacteroides merdae TaxID=46503 RepID=UPI0031B5945C
GKPGAGRNQTASLGVCTFNCKVINIHIGTNFILDKTQLIAHKKAWNRLVVRSTYQGSCIA